MASDLVAFRRDYAITVWLSYLALVLGGGGAGLYVMPVFTGTSAVYGDWRPEWEFWTERSGIASAIGVALAVFTLQAGWSCLQFKGNVGEGLDRRGQEIITRSMTFAGLTVVGVLGAWVVRGIF